MTAPNELYKAISKKEYAHPEVSRIVAGNFNAGKFKSIFRYFYKHDICATKGGKKL
jgi:hypothetical protein